MKFTNPPDGSFRPKSFAKNRAFPTLKGDLAGFWAVWVSGNWRVIFQFENGQAYDVDLIDYH
jgi:plasmid maintenance system killer protein